MAEQLPRVEAGARRVQRGARRRGRAVRNSCHIVEPSGFATDWAGSSAVRAAPIAAYDPDPRRAADGAERGDPKATATAIFETRAFASSARADARPTTFQVVGRIMRDSVHSPHLKK